MLRQHPPGLALPLCADLEQLPIADNSLDALWSSYALQWCNPRKAFPELARSLRPLRGPLILSAAIMMLVFAVSTGHSALAVIGAGLGSWLIFGAMADLWLRTGNSGAVYFAVNGQAYGPAAPGAQVVSNVEMSPGSLTERFALADLGADPALAQMVAMVQTSDAAEGQSE